MRQMIRVLKAVTAMFFIAGFGLPAAPAVSAPDPETPVLRLQLSAFMAPVRRDNGHGGTTAVTPLLDLTDGTNAEEVCWLSPRIMDAFMTSLHRDPIRIRSPQGLDSDDLKKRLTDVVNHALGRDLIGGVELVRGTRPARNASVRFFKSATCSQSRVQ